ncbi:MAG: hypothetical protein R3F56_12880 [Planctomycetota bacterium]
MPAAVQGPDPVSRDATVAVLIYAVVAVLSGVLGALIVGSPRGAATGLLGPWAGLAVGHRDCTMATQMPAVSFAWLAAGALLLMALASARATLRAATLVAIAVWSLGWAALGLLSMVNASF